MRIHRPCLNRLLGRVLRACALIAATVALPDDHDVPRTGTQRASYEAGTEQVLLKDGHNHTHDPTTKDALSRGGDESVTTAGPDHGLTRPGVSASTASTWTGRAGDLRRPAYERLGNRFTYCAGTAAREVIVKVTHRRRSGLSRTGEALIGLRVMRATRPDLPVYPGPPALPRLGAKLLRAAPRPGRGKFR